MTIFRLVLILLTGEKKVFIVVVVAVFAGLF